jgi:general secretion pathway protein C
LEGINELAGRAARPVVVLLIAGIAYTLADGLWFFLSPPAPDARPTANSAVPVRNTSTSIDINQIKARNLFGAADSTASGTSDTPTVVTSLPLILQGVFVADHQDDDATPDAAIVAQKGKPGRIYEIGDTLPGNATLLEVHATHIVLRRAGVREILSFPKPDALAVETNPGTTAEQESTYARALQPDSTQAPSRAASRQTGPAPANARDFVEQYRGKIDASRPSDLSAIGLTPVNEGSASGYRIGALADSPYLKQTGLQAGDVLLSVNGRPVGDVQSDRLEIDDILAQGSARLEVQRGDRRFFVTASLK